MSYIIWKVLRKSDNREIQFSDIQYQTRKREGDFLERYEVLERVETKKEPVRTMVGKGHREVEMRKRQDAEQRKLDEARAGVENKTSPKKKAVKKKVAKKKVAKKSK